MSIKDQYTVRPIRTYETYEWLVRKHYAKRVPPVSFAFGLYEQVKGLRGICTFGIPASRFEFNVQPYELNRLCVDEGLEKNVLSYFVSQALSLFPEQALIVSYADPNQGHHGYIYQATNWMYTGLSSAEKKMFVNGQELHRKTFYNLYGTSSIPLLEEKGLEIEFEPQEGKHRYFWAKTKDLKRELIAKYVLLPYPKGENQRYDASYEPQVQSLLFQ